MYSIYISKEVKYSIIKRHLTKLDIQFACQKLKISFGKKKKKKSYGKICKLNQLIFDCGFLLNNYRNTSGLFPAGMIMCCCSYLI